MAVNPFDPSLDLGVQTPPIDTSSGINFNAINNVQFNPVAFNTKVDLSSGNSSGAPKPSVKSLSKIKSTLLRPALTSHYECYFNPPNDVRNYLRTNRQFNYDLNAELITLSCSEASLPGSSLITNETNDDYTGVTERLAYRRQYDDRADFTFYVDHGRSDGNYNIIWFFENWIQYIANEQYLIGKGSAGVESPNYNYRFRFPDGSGKSGEGYRAAALYVNKFERDFQGSYLSYRFLKAYPIAINSMPISYDSSELLKCTVSFTYTRYLVERLANDSTLAIQNAGNQFGSIFETAAAGTPTPTAATPELTQGQIITRRRQGLL